MRTKSKDIQKKILAKGPAVLCMFYCFHTTTHAVFDPEPIPEEEKTILSTDYDDEEARRIEEKSANTDKIAVY